MQEVSHLLVSLRSEEVYDPSPGFFAGVMQHVGERRSRAFLCEPLFARSGLRAPAGVRIADDPGGPRRIPGHPRNRFPTGPSPEAVMAQQDSPLSIPPPRRTICWSRSRPMSSTSLLERRRSRNSWNPKLACAVALVLVFLCGGALGALLMDLRVHNRMRPPAFDTTAGTDAVLRTAPKGTGPHPRPVRADSKRA